MKPKPGDKIETLAAVPSDFRKEIIPAGTQGAVIECYDDPEGYCVDLRIPDKRLVGGARYENVVLSPDQFKVLRKKG